MTLMVSLFSKDTSQGAKVGLGLLEGAIRITVPGAIGEGPVVSSQCGLLGANLSNMAVVVLLLT